MNAPTHISLAGSYEATIGALCPGCDEDSMAVRVELAALRDSATVGVQRATDEAARILSVVVSLASSAVYSGEPTSNLIRVLATLKFTVEAARHIDRLTRNG